MVRWKCKENVSLERGKLKDKIGKEVVNGIGKCQKGKYPLN